MLMGRGHWLQVGFGSSFVGVGATNLLGSIRQMLNPEATSPNPPQDVLTMSAAYASYMAVSSNLRYQVTPVSCIVCMHQVLVHHTTSYLQDLGPSEPDGAAD